jgi:hypothetical protein
MASVEERLGYISRVFHVIADAQSFTLQGQMLGEAERPTEALRVQPGLVLPGFVHTPCELPEIPMIGRWAAAGLRTAYTYGGQALLDSCAGTILKSGMHAGLNRATHAVRLREELYTGAQAAQRRDTAAFRWKYGYCQAGVL